MPKLSVKASLLALSGLMLAAAWLPARAQSAGTPVLSVDVSTARNPISPDIYGIASYGLDARFAAEIKVANIRWGGDGTSRYNWQVDSSNAGYDWYFMGGSGAATAPTPGASADLMVTTYKPANANALITIPILPYVNKSYAWSCSFPVSDYGAQTSTNPYVFPLVNGVTQTCGNSIATVATNGSTQLNDTNILANHVPNTTSLQQGWVQHLVNTFGTGDAGGVKYYQLDNEPLGWSNTHRDVEPATPTYATIVQLGQTYAAAVKQVDPSALILGPSDFTLGGWVGTAGQQGGLWAGQYYLQQMAAYEQAHHERLLDYFDEHYYFDTSSPAAQLASTRTLWDPTYNGGTWVEQYDFDGPMQLIPRFKSWISTYYPGTKLSLSEYSIDSGQKSIVDAIAEMDVLGIYGREQLDFANMWNPPAPTDPIAYAFRMFRNYDGNGDGFGDTSISAVSSDPGALSIYAAQRSSDSAITILAINKTTASIGTAISLANVSLPPSAQVYVYSAANLNSIVKSTAAPITTGSLPYTFPSYSAVLFVVQPAPSATTSAVTAAASPVSVGTPINLNVVVTASGATPTGTVSFTEGSTSLGTAALVNGKTSYSIPSLTAGSHTIVASYAGSSMDAASTASIVVQVSPAAVATRTTLAISPLSSRAGQAVVLQATVTPATGTSMPMGTVTFDDGTSSLGSVPLASGAAMLNLTNLGVGSHTVSATYSGDAADLTSSAPSQTITVTAADSPAPPSPSPPPVVSDYTMSLSENVLTTTSTGSAALTVTVAPLAAFSGAISFACSGLPSGWGCSFAPATLSGAGTQTTMLTVRAASSGANAPPSSVTLLAVISPCCLLLMGLGSTQRRRREQLSFALLSILLSGCGGDSHTAAQGSTTVSTSTVTVTASGTSLPTHTQEFNLTVDGG